MNVFEKIFDDILLEAHKSIWDITSKNWERGQQAEDYFKNVVQFNGYGWQLATQHEELRQHVDGHMFSTYTNKTYKIEVKTKKQQSCKPDNLLIEIRSRQPHFKGWIYGSSDYIAFMYELATQKYPYQKDIYILINTAKLKELTEKLTGVKWVVEQGVNKLIFDPKNLVVGNSCEGFAPKIYGQRPNDPYSLITRIPLNTVLGSMQKDKDYFVMKYVAAKEHRELKASNTDIEQYKMKLL